MHRRITLAGLLCLAAGVALVAGQAPQTSAPPTPTFKAQVEYVEVDALVTDEEGRLVPDLTKDDFQVFEDGKLQTITSFSLVNIPVERAERPLFAARPIEADVQSNARPFDGRIYVLILDDLHVSFFRTPRVRAAARQFIEQNLGANDLMAVIFTGGRAQDAQEFTSNKRLLISAVDKFTGRKLPSATISRNNEYFRQSVAPIQDARIPDPDEQQRVYNTRSLLSTLRQVAEWFGGVRGRRKTMMLMSEGIDYDVTDLFRRFDQPVSAAGSIMADIREAVAATARSNVSIYAVDPRGLSDSSDDSIEVQEFADHEDRSAGIGPASLRNEMRVSQDSLRELAEETGGFAAVNQNDLGDAFARIVRDNSNYYVLAYYPPSDKRDGKFHRIEVKVNRPGLTVRARRGYMSPKGKAPKKDTPTAGMSPEIFDAINSPLQVSGVTMRAFAAPFKGAEPNASVLVGLELRGQDLTLAGSSKVEISYMAVDAKSKVHGGHNDALALTLKPESQARVAQSGIRLLNRMELAPGRYQLRIAARDQGKNAVGSLVYDLEVPDFYKAPFAMSGVVLTSLGSGAMMTAKADEQMRAVLPAAPIAQRAFPQNDEIALFAEVYDNAGGAPHKVDITASVLTDDGRVLFKNEETRDSSELQGKKGGYGYTTRIPLSEIPPGPYVLVVEARSRLGDETTVTRQIQFDVLPPVRQ
jgi:VWFA-related protein